MSLSGGVKEKTNNAKDKDKDKDKDRDKDTILIVRIVRRVCLVVPRGNSAG